MKTFRFVCRRRRTARRSSNAVSAIISATAFLANNSLASEEFRLAAPVPYDVGAPDFDSHGLRDVIVDGGEQ
jgi:hypothetical protein